MSRPSKRISPSTRAVGTVSCIRLMQRSSVDLPQPDGPMMATTCFGCTTNDTSRTTRAAPKYASSDSIDTHGGGASATRGVSIAAEAVAGTRGEPRRETDDEDEREEDERPGPSLSVP